MLTALVAILIAVHLYAFILESFFWTKPLGLTTFKMKPEQAEASRVLAFNQGFYNLFLALGIALGWLLNATDLIDFGALSAFMAGAVLAYSQPSARRAAVLQAGPAVLYFILRFAGQ